MSKSTHPDRAYRAGHASFYAGRERFPDEADQWKRGWDDAKAENERYNAKDAAGVKHKVQPE